MKFFANHSQESLLLEEKCQRALSRRQGDNYSKEEMLYVSELSHQLLDPEKIESGAVSVSERDFESLRALCKLAKIDLKPASAIKSHRPLIGPSIVFLKRLTWPLIKFHLKDTFKAQEQFNTELVRAYARLFNRPAS